jgi:hypothetical protein
MNILTPSKVSELTALYLMSQSKILFIANSSFSWWGGYLALRNPESRVIVPSPWLKGDYDSGRVSDVYLPDMQLIPAIYARL